MLGSSQLEAGGGRGWGDNRISLGPAWFVSHAPMVAAARSWFGVGSGECAPRWACHVAFVLSVQIRGGVAVFGVGRFANKLQLLFIDVFVLFDAYRRQCKSEQEEWHP